MGLDALADFGPETYQQKDNPVGPTAPPVHYYEVLAPGIVVDESSIAPPITGMGSLADQVGLHGIDSGYRPSAFPGSGYIAPGPAPGYAGDPGLRPAQLSHADDPIGAPAAIPENRSSGDPNQNGGSGQRPWRAGYGQVAPGFSRQPDAQSTTVAPADVTAGRAGYGDLAPGARQLAGTGNAADGDAPVAGAKSGGTGDRTMSDIVNDNKDLVEKSLGGGTDYLAGDFLLNSILGGISGAAFGGPLAKYLDYGTKFVVANGDAAAGWLAGTGEGADGIAGSARRAALSSLGLGERAALWYQGNFGLGENEMVLQPLKDRDIHLDKAIRDQGDLLEPEKLPIEKAVAERALTAEGSLARQHLLTRDLMSADEVARMDQYQFLRGGGSGELPKGVKLWADQSALVESRQLLREKLAVLDSAGTGNLKSAGNWKTHIQNFAKGALTVEAAQFADDRLDSWLFGKMKTKPSWYTDSLAVPAAMLVSGGWLKKGATMVGAHILGKALDEIIPAEDHPLDRFVRPDNLEAISVAGAMLIPMREENMKVRLAYMGVAWLASHGISWLTGSDQKAVRDQALHKVDEDTVSRTASSMESAIDKLKELDDIALRGSVRRPMSVLEYYLAAQLSGQAKDAVSGDRSAASYLTAAAETRLDKGTMVFAGQGGAGTSKLRQLANAIAASFTTAADHQFDHILPGRDLDLGGQALTYLVAARSEISQAKNDTQALLQSNANATVNGTKVRKQEVADLDKVEERVDLSLSKIYGKHDISSNYKQLEEYTFELNQGAVDNLRKQLKQKLGKPGTNDQQYLAKLNRDLAMIDLAFAGFEVGYNGIGSRFDGAAGDSFVKEAQTALDKASQEDPDNQDTPQLDQIAGDIEKIVPLAIKKQGASTVNNPFGITNWR